MEKIKVALLFISLIIVSCATSKISPVNDVHFTGETITDRSTGLTIMGDIENGIVVVTNIYYHYGLIIPYSENWVFSSNNSSIITGNAENKNFSLTIFNTSDSPEEYLRSLKEKFSIPGVLPGLISAKMFSQNDQPILRTMIYVGKIPDSPFIRAKQLNLFSAKKSKDLLYQFHLSVIGDDNEMNTIDENYLIKMATVGLSADFELKK